MDAKVPTKGRESPSISRYSVRSGICCSRHRSLSERGWMRDSTKRRMREGGLGIGGSADLGVELGVELGIEPVAELDVELGVELFAELGFELFAELGVELGADGVRHRLHP